MSGKFIGESYYTMCLELVNQYLSELETISPITKDYNLTLQSCLLQYMRVLDAAKQTNSNEFFKKNTTTIIEMCDKIFKTITVQQSQLSEHKELLQKLIDTFLEAAENIAKTNPTLCIKLFEKALEIAEKTQDQDNTWFRNNAKRIKDLRLLLPNEFNSTESIQKIDKIIRSYAPTKNQQRMQFAQLFAQQEAQKNTDVALPSKEELHIGARQPKRPVLSPLVAEKTSPNTIDVVNYIHKELVSYEQTSTSLSYMNKKALITAILKVFNSALLMYIQSENIDSIIKDHQQLTLIYNKIKQINQKDILGISLQNTDLSMSQINTIINTHSNTNSSFGVNIIEGQVKPVSILDDLSKELETYGQQINKTQQPHVKQTSKKDLLNEQQIIFAKKYFELNPIVNKLSRHNPATIQDPITKQTTTMQLPYSVMKSDDGKLYAFYSGKNTYGKTANKRKGGLLGEGHFGRVKVAEPLADDDDQKVVVKIQKVEKLTSINLDIMHREKETQKLTGDFIGSAKRKIMTKDSSTTKDYGFSVLYRAPNLRDYLSNKRHLDIKQKLEIILAVLKDLKERFHDHEIVHGDLNLGNILYNEKEGKAYIIDYGFSGRANKQGWIDLPYKLPSSSTTWFAPEQCSLGKATYKSDIYNFGRFIYDNLAGRDIYLKELASNMLRRNIQDRPDIESCITEVNRKLNDLSNQNNQSRGNILGNLLRRNR